MFILRIGAAYPPSVRRAMFIAGIGPGIRSPSGGRDGRRKRPYPHFLFPAHTIKTLLRHSDIGVLDTKFPAV